jgi:hypothetical protein
MKKIVIAIIAAVICAVMFTSCSSKSGFESDEVITLSNGKTLRLENLQWLEKLIDLSKNDKTGNYYGRIWLDNFKGKEIFVTNMMLGSGGVMYYFFDNSGASLIVKDYVKYHIPNPLIEEFAGKDYALIEVEREELDNFIQQNVKLDIVVYSSY